jgi:biotin operon repressor
MSYWHLNQLQAHKLKELSLLGGYIGQYLAGKFDDAGRWQISRKRIREETGRSNASIAKALRELEEAGVIVAHREGRRRATEYFHALTCPPECQVESHRKPGKSSERPTRRTTEWPTEGTTEWPTEETTNKPSNRPFIKDRDPQAAGLSFLEILKEQLKPLVSSERPARAYLQLQAAIDEEPQAVEKLLEVKLARADYPERYLDQVLANNPWSLNPRKRAAKVKEAQRLEAIQPLLDQRREETETAKAERLQGVSEANRAWLGSNPSPYALRYAQVASELGIEIPLGTETVEAGHLVKAAQSEREESYTWQGKEKATSSVIVS